MKEVLKKSIRSVLETNRYVYHPWNQVLRNDKQFHNAIVNHAKKFNDLKIDIKGKHKHDLDEALDDFFWIL